jgi:hypothetical protein
MRIFFMGSLALEDERTVVLWNTGSSLNQQLNIIPEDLSNQDIYNLYFLQNIIRLIK